MQTSNGQIGFSRERLLCVLIAANMKRHCPITARIIARLSSV